MERPVSLKGADLVVTDQSGETHYYVLTQDKSFGNPVVHEKAAPSVPLNTGYSSPTQAGGLYDVRDSEGDKSIAHLDWTLGAGQKTLDREDANASRFWSSENIDVSRPGEMRLARLSADVHEENVAGPVYSALGYIWIGDAAGGLKFSSDNGANWTACDGITSTRPIGGFTTDGTRLYICYPAGATYGIYANSAADLNTFARFGSTGTTEAIRHVCYFSGYLLGATTAKAAVVNTTTGVFGGSSALETPSWLNQTMTSVALVAAGNAAYWVVSQGSRSYVYRLTLTDTDAGITMTTEQSAELPAGFIATCALGYLSSVYVGGYWESVTSGVGKGAVYEIAESYVTPLFELGEHPETTDDPEAEENDNRIWALCSASKDLYVLTNQAIYRWDIDDGGYSHLCSHPGSGSGTILRQWDAGSIYSWDGTQTVPNVPPHYQFPTGYVASTSSIQGSGTCAWDYPAGIATYDFVPGAGKLERTTASAAPTLDNALGTTVEVEFGPYGSSTGQMKYTGNTGAAVPSAIRDAYPNYTGYIRDGTREMKWSYCGGYVYGTSPLKEMVLWRWDGSAWVVAARANCGANFFSDPHITASLQGTTARLIDSTGVTLSTELTKATTDTARIVHEFIAGSGVLSTVNVQITTAVDYILLNSEGTAPSEEIVDALFRPSIAQARGNIMAPYAEAEYNVVLESIGITQSDPAIISFATPHGIAAGGTQIVNINGSDCLPSCDGNWLATWLSDTDISIPFNVSASGGSTCTMTYNHYTGYTHTVSGVAASGWLEQSGTSFHSGSLLKDFRAVEVTHDDIPDGATLMLTWEIDGVGGATEGVTTGRHTVFTMNERGYAIKTRLALTCDTTTTRSPIIRAVNVLWDFVKPIKHTYILECKEGAGGGHWHEDAEEAVAFLFTSADQRCTFEDRFSGEYIGSVDEVQLLGANYTPREGYSGIVKLTTREQA